MSTATLELDAPQPPSIAEASPSDQEMQRLEAEALASMGEPGQKPPADDSAGRDDGKQQQQQQQDKAKPAEKPGQPEPNGKDQPAKDEPKGDAKGKQQPPKADAPRNPEDIKDSPTDSRYARAMKDLQRMGLTWDRLNSEKGEVAQARQELERERAQFHQERQEFDQRISTLAKGPIPDAEINGKRYGADLIREHILNSFADGNADEGNAALDLLISQAQKGAAAAAQQPSEAQILAYNRETELACAKRPELLDQNAPISRALKIMLAQPDVRSLFIRRPGGFSNAVELADILAIGMEAQANAEKLGTSAAEVKRLKERIAELEALTSPGEGDQPSKAPTQTEEERFDSLSLEQQEAFLRRQLQPG